jgi:hypothetical protein
VEWSWICDRRSVGQSVLVSGRPLGPMSRFYVFFSLTCTCFFMYSALSDGRTGVYFAVHITHWSESRRIYNHILLSHLRITLPGGQRLRIHIPMKGVVQLIPRDIGFPFCRLSRFAGFGFGLKRKRLHYMFVVKEIHSVPTQGLISHVLLREHGIESWD